MDVQITNNSIKSWDCGEISGTVVAVLDTTGTLTISGFGYMKDFYSRPGHTGIYLAPWNNVKKNITKLIINDGVKSVGSDAFSNCNNLNSVALGNNISYISSWAFSECGSLIDIDFPHSLTHIHEYAFSDCKNLTNLKIRENVTHIDDGAFKYCFKLTSITCFNSLFAPQLYFLGSQRKKCSKSFPEEIMTTCTLFVPKGTVAGYRNADGWKEFANIQEIKKTKKISTTAGNPQNELQILIGLDSVKSEISTFVNFIKIQQERHSRGMKSSQPSYHCVFTGNPGTGKTTVARIIAEIYKELGILEEGHLVETDRSGLVAEYVGQTAVKTNKIIDSALDGVLFIDEAYSLIAGGDNDFGKEAIATLLKRMEDDRDRLVVVLAGYSEEMQNFINSNPGLHSRFNRYINFQDYSAEELYQIFESLSKQFDYTIAKNTQKPLQNYLTKIVAEKDENFGNGRFVRNLFEKTIERQANRLSKETNLTNEKLSEICSADISDEIK
jgi:AAA+ superfamily predicted ATPase